MNIEAQLQAFLDYHSSQGDQVHYMVWSQSSESTYGEFNVDWTKLTEDRSPLSCDEAVTVATCLTACWHTWMYCRMNPVVSDDLVVLTKTKMNEIITKLKEVITSRDELMKLVSDRRNQKI